MPHAVVVDGAFDWEDDRAAAQRLERLADLRGARQGVHEAPRRAARAPARHLRRTRVRRGDLLPARARHHGRRAPARPPHRRRELPRRPRPLELLGLLVDRLPRAARAVRGRRAARRAGERVQGHGEGAPPGRHRGDPRRRLQPHGRGQPPRPDAELQGHRQPELLPADAGRPALLHGLHGHGQQPEPRAPERAAADHGLAAPLRDRVPRRRVPLRPRLGARARAVRGRPALVVLRHDPPGPGAEPGEADRRAVGRRSRAATRSATSRCSGASGTASTATRSATSGAAKGSISEFATRFTGSADLYGDGRRPFASINFITAHDGFTLRDLVSYNEKHNEANLEGNRDGADDNRSWNCGVEGETDDPAVLALRARQQRNLLATLLLSQGVPMLVGGDELGRTQGGNNNAWCQDNEISWLDWDETDEGLLAFTRRLIQLRRDQPVFRRRDFLVGSDERSGLPGRRVAAPRRREARRRRLEERDLALARGVPERRRDREPQPARHADPRRLVPDRDQRAPRRRGVHDAGRALRRALGRRAADRRAGVADARARATS